jgi:hypothetical protein
MQTWHRKFVHSKRADSFESALLFRAKRIPPSAQD